MVASLFCSGQSDRRVCLVYATFIFVSLPYFYYLGTIVTDNSTPDQGMKKSSMLRSRNHWQTKNIISSSTSTQSRMETGKFPSLLKGDATQSKEKKHSYGNEGLGLDLQIIDQRTTMYKEKKNVGGTREVWGLLGWKLTDYFLVDAKESDGRSNILDEKKKKEEEKLKNMMIPRVLHGGEIDELNISSSFLLETRKPPREHDVYDDERKREKLQDEIEHKLFLFKKSKKGNVVSSSSVKKAVELPYHLHNAKYDEDTLSSHPGTNTSTSSNRMLEVSVGAPYFRLKESFYEEITFSSGYDIAASDDLSVLAMSSYVLKDTDSSSYLPRVTIGKLLYGHYATSNLDLGDVTPSFFPTDVLTQLAVSGDGKTITVAQAYYFRGFETEIPDGTIKIFKESVGTWSLRDTLAFSHDTIGVGSKSGLVVSLNENGYYILVGRRYFNQNSGIVELYSFDGSVYVMEKNIEGKSSEAAEVGSSVMITRDGSCFIYGSVRGNDRKGFAEVYCKDSNEDWIYETIFYGSDVRSDFGSSVAITSTTDGDRVAAVGARFHDSDGRVDAGLVQVFKKMSDGTIWEQLGSNLFGQRGQSIEYYYVGDEFGFSISLGNIQNDKSLRIAIGAPNVDADVADKTDYYHGEVTLYEISDVSTGTIDWNEIGNGINGQSKDSTGSSVILSKDGKSIAVASPDRGEDNKSRRKGIVHIYLQDEYSDEPSQVPSKTPSDSPSSFPSSLPSNKPSVNPSVSAAPSMSPTESPSISHLPTLSYTTLSEMVLELRGVTILSDELEAVIRKGIKEAFAPVNVTDIILSVVPYTSRLLSTVDRRELEDTVPVLEVSAIVGLPLYESTTTSADKLGDVEASVAREAEITGFNVLVSAQVAPSEAPSNIPSIEPSSKPSELPSPLPSDIPSDQPSDVPSDIPSDQPTSLPSSIPSSIPSSFLDREFIIKSNFGESTEDLCLTASDLDTGKNIYLRKCQLDSDTVRIRQVWTFNDKNGLELAIPIHEKFCLKSIFRQLQLSTCDSGTDDSIENFHFACPHNGDVGCMNGMLTQSRPSGIKYFIGFSEGRMFERLRFFREGTVNESLNTWSLVFKDSW